MMRNTILATAALAIAVVPQGGTLDVGQKPAAGKFNEVIWNWDGTQSLGDYLGEPVLVDFWGKN